MISYVNTTEAPQAIGPYSQAIVFGNLMFTSGQIPLDPTTGAIAGATIEEQALQVMKNLSAVFKAQNTDFENVIKTTCFLADMKDFAAFNKIYGEFFTGKPARSCVAVRELPKNVLCEVEAIVALN
ncbi:MAG: regulator [Firmicutes bacterium HGW-Firmicutes-16]|nr:MAG: regulator [Firmicutes bacterium HGW-Firmicutes-16]